MAGALLLVIGASIAFAGGALDGQRRSTSPLASTPPPPAPVLLAPRTSLVSSATIDLTLVRPAGLRADQEYTIRVVVNDQRALERPLPGAEQLALRDVPLEQGHNSIHATLVGAGGEGPPSTAVTVVRDDIAPLIHVSRPEPDSTVYTQLERLRGRTEAGADMIVVDAGGHELDTVVGADGRFETVLPLALGGNSFVLRSRDAAGNQARTRLELTRVESAARVNLSVAPHSLALDELPAIVELTVAADDELGRPAEGAEVTFSVSPPNRSTTTYRTTTRAGRARWPDLEISGGPDARCTWLVTVLAVLPSGTELRADQSFTIE
ncbi:hypothetical protein BH24CHL5_BH24CHL5_09350 [soil metagenome]